jgi:cystathionine beta-lyase
VAKICIENNIIICSDEIHSDLVFPGNKHIPIATLSGKVSDITVTLISASKTFNIAGLKSSAAIITNQALREQFALAATGFVGSVNLLGELALRTSYDHGEAWLEHLLTYLESNRKQLVEIVNNDLPGIQILEPEGTYLGWLNCTNLNLEDPAKFFLENARVAVNSGTWFGEEYRQYIRLNFGCPQDRLLMGLERIKNSLRQR